MKITKEWLVEKRACKEGQEWFEKEGKTDVYELIEQLKDVNCEWASWLITRVLDKIDNVKFGVFAAEQVLEIYEKQYPHDERPRKAIEAAKAYINNPTNKNAHAASAAAEAAYTAAYAAADAAYTASYAAADAANTAAYAAAHAAAHAAVDAAADAAYTASRAAAYAAAYAAADADYTASRAAAYAAAYAAADADYTAAYAAADAAYTADAAAKKEMQLKIIAYGEQLLRANPKLKQEAKK